MSAIEALSAPPMADDELFIDREFDAPIGLVWRMWEDVDHRRRWWAPNTFRTVSLESDFRVGGAWRAAIAGADGVEKRHGGVYREVVRERRLSFTFAWDEGSGPTLETVVTVTLEEAGGKTRQRFHQTPFEDVATRDSHIGGWSGLLDRQADYIAQHAARQSGEQVR
jgi:uncharacterized protein YndB with AHSA1/START domain